MLSCGGQLSKESSETDRAVGTDITSSEEQQLETKYLEKKIRKQSKGGDFKKWELIYQMAKSRPM